MIEIEGRGRFGYWYSIYNSNRWSVCVSVGIHLYEDRIIKDYNTVC